MLYHINIIFEIYIEKVVFKEILNIVIFNILVLLNELDVDRYWFFESLQNRHIEKQFVIISDVLI